MSENTKESWQRFSLPDQPDIIVAADGKIVCRPPAPKDFDDLWEDRARLISAAPALLDIAKARLQDLYDRLHPSLSQAAFDAHPEVVATRAALTKATGAPQC